MTTDPTDAKSPDAGSGSKISSSDNLIDISNIEIIDFQRKPAPEVRAPKETSAAGGAGGKKPPPRQPRARTGPPSYPEDGRVSIKRGPHTFAEEITAAVNALASGESEYFRFGSRIVRPEIIELRTRDAITHSPGLAQATDVMIRLALARRTKWFRFDKRSGEWIGIPPPKEIAAHIAGDIMAARFPSIASVTASPFLRLDGSLVDRLGYDQRSWTYYLAAEPLAFEPIPEKPSRAEADAALADLSHLIEEFPFVSDVDRSAALSQLLTPMLRTLMDVAPAHGIIATEQGSGKSFLTDIGSMMLNGERAGILVASTDFIETEKALVGSMLSGLPLICLDNCKGNIDSNVLAQCIERSIMELRMLGASPLYKSVNLSCVMINGNKISISGDNVRRVIPCRLNAKLDDPYYRTFDCNPLEEVRRNRGKYVRAALLLGRFGLQAPPHGKPELASFGWWDSVVRRPLIALGCSDPCDGISRSRSEAPDKRELSSVFAALENVFGNTFFTCLQAVQIATDSAKNEDGKLLFPHAATLAPGMTIAQQEVLQDRIRAVAERNGRISTRSFGRWLARNKSCISNGLILEEGEIDGHSEAPMYRILISKD